MCLISSYWWMARADEYLCPTHNTITGTLQSFSPARKAEQIGKRKEKIYNKWKIHDIDCNYMTFLS